MKKTIQFLLPHFLLAIISISAFAQSGEINGQIIDKEKNEALFGATISIYHAGTNDFVDGDRSDVNGFYAVKPLDAGTYDVKITYIGYDTMTQEGVKVHDGEMTFLDATLNIIGIEGPIAHVIEWREPRIGKPNDVVLDFDVLDNLPTNDVTDAIAIISPAVYQEDDNSEIQVRGSRVGTTLFFLDGVKMDGSVYVPSSAVQEMRVITGGIPAKYGDMTGGVVLITTKSYFTSTK